MPRLMLLIAAVVLTACQSTGQVRGASVDAMAPPTGEYSYGGGDGTTKANAIVVNAPNEAVGVAAEYAWIQKNYPGARTKSTSLYNKDGRAYDSIDFDTKDGAHRTLYFDISSFFGKF